MNAFERAFQGPAAAGTKMMGNSVTIGGIAVLAVLEPVEAIEQDGPGPRDTYAGVWLALDAAERAKLPVPLPRNLPVVLPAHYGMPVLRLERVKENGHLGADVFAVVPEDVGGLLE